MKSIATFAFFIMTYGIPTIIVLSHLLHFILTRKLDKFWFNDGFFSISELAVYSSYPLSLIRTIFYTSAVCLPFVAKKRFGDLSPANQLNLFVKLLCYIWLLLFLLGMVMVVIFLASFFLLP